MWPSWRQDVHLGLKIAWWGGHAIPRLCHGKEQALWLWCHHLLYSAGGWGYHRLERTEQASMCLKWWNAWRTPTSHHDVAELCLDILIWSILLNHACNWITDNRQFSVTNACEPVIILYWIENVIKPPVAVKYTWDVADLQRWRIFIAPMQQQLQSQGDLCTDMIHMQMLTKHTDAHKHEDDNDNNSSSTKGTCVTNQTRWPRFCAADTYRCVEAVVVPGLFSWRAGRFL